VCLPLDAAAPSPGLSWNSQRRDMRSAAGLPFELDRGLAPDAQGRRGIPALHGNRGVRCEASPANADGPGAGRASGSGIFGARSRHCRGDNRGERKAYRQLPWGVRGCQGRTSGISSMVRPDRASVALGRPGPPSAAFPGPTRAACSGSGSLRRPMAPKLARPRGVAIRLQLAAKEGSCLAR